MKQNIYDYKIFFDKYRQMNRSKKGLEGAGEWKTLEKMLPDFKGKRVLDLGCGFGWHCQYAIEHGAKSVTGVDLSHNMLKVAIAQTSSKIMYINSAIEDINFPNDTFDVVVSSLAFHYIESFEAITKKVYSWLVKNGNFVFSVEHPTFTAYGTQEWYKDDAGKIIHFPVDNYFIEGIREANFLGNKVQKYHRTLTTYLNTLLKFEFEIVGVVEPQPNTALLETIKGMKDELRRPMMLIISATKK